MAYLYGYICHYTLDCQVHPFIYYKSGIFNSHKPDTYRYNGMHQKQEYLIDLWYIHQKEQIEPAKFKVHNHIFNVKNFSTDLKLTITNSIEKTYNLKNINPTYLKSIRYMKLFFRLANYDPIGFKKLLYTLLDHLTPKYVINVSELSFHVSSKNTTTYLNLEHKPWHYPWSKTETFTTSIKDLYEIALKKATTTIIEVTDLLEKNQLNKEKIKQIFPNLSFSTGRNCEEKLEMKYFEY